jgi:hypothetical protein
MRHRYFLAVAAIAYLAATAQAQGSRQTVSMKLPIAGPGGHATICVSATGGVVQGYASCSGVVTSDQSRMSCLCPGGATPARAPICGRGERPAPDSAGANAARLAAVQRGGLSGARFKGRSLCIEIPSAQPNYGEINAGYPGTAWDGYSQLPRSDPQ